MDWHSWVPAAAYCAPLMSIEMCLSAAAALKYPVNAIAGVRRLRRQMRRTLIPMAILTYTGPCWRTRWALPLSATAAAHCCEMAMTFSSMVLLLVHQVMPY